MPAAPSTHPSSTHQPSTPRASLDQLRNKIQRLEQGRPLDAAQDHPVATGIPLGIPEIDGTLPWGGLPRGMVHEILCDDASHGAPTAFLLTLIALQCQAQRKEAGGSGPVLWVSCRDDLFPPALPVYGCDPADFLFVRCTRGEDVLWAMEDGLRCSALTAVAGDVGALDFPLTRRLQLAATHGDVPLFLHRAQTRAQTRAQKSDVLLPSAAVTRWQVTARSPDSATLEARSGDPAWTVHLRRCRGGRPGQWPVTWSRVQQALCLSASAKKNKKAISGSASPQMASAA